MNKNYLFWGVGGLIVLAVILTLTMKSASDDSVVTPGTTATTTSPGGTTAPHGTAGKPIVVTTGFSSVSTSTAVVVGTVNPQGSETTYWFEYGTTLSLGSTANTMTAPAGYQQLGASGYITGLKPATSYYFRLGARNAYGTTFGGPYSFITTSK